MAGQLRPDLYEAGERSAVISRVTAKTAGVTLAALLAAAAPGCESPTQPGGGSPRADTLQHATTHFVFHYIAADAPSIPAVAAYVEAHWPRIVSDLRAGEMPVVQVHLYDTHDAMAEAVRPFVGSIPTWASGLVTGVDRIHLISPARSGEPVERFRVNVLHEFAHCVTLRVNAAVANNPRWLWEAVALFEAQQRVDPRTLPYVASGQLPGLAALSDMSNRQIYDVGFLLGEFIVENGGLDALRALIVGRGDTAAVLGLDTPAFEAQWRQFIQARYGV